MADREEFWDRPTPVILPTLPADVRVNGFYRDLAEVRCTCDRLLMASDLRNAAGIEFAARDLCTLFLVVSATVHLVRTPHVQLEQQQRATLDFRACEQSDEYTK
jgi:hypothetical protein